MNEKLTKIFHCSYSIPNNQVTNKTAVSQVDTEIECLLTKYTILTHHQILEDLV